MVDYSRQSGPDALQASTAFRKGLVPLAMLLLVLLAILRSAVATRLDSFSVDENYHITAGVSYVRVGDYRINPEHPPLVKLWVGAVMPSDSFHLPPLQVFNDKAGERIYAAQTVFLKNDPDRIQRRARLAMYGFNGLLLLAFALIARRIFGSVIALAALAFLAIDPTVAAHMPVVMTDLPITLLSAISLLLAWLAFVDWKLRHLIAAAVALGLALATKHSGIIVAEVITAFGLFMALRKLPANPDAAAAPPTRFRRLLLLAAVLAGAYILLWGTYRFRYTESVSPQETFNRSLSDKINDLSSPRHRLLMNSMAEFHILPRAYLWGLADVIRAGVEGRGYPLYFMDRMYTLNKPRYFFPVQILIKLPLGLLALSLAGLALVLARKVEPEVRSPFWLMLGFSAFFLFILAVSNSFYAGVRHALPVYPVLALLAGAVVVVVVQGNSLSQKALVAAAALWAIISAVPALRPWEYHNALAGGTSRAYLHFSDEGIDLGLRTKELAGYYHQRLEPKGELPYFMGYLPIPEELQARGIHTVEQKWDSGELADGSDTLTGTLITEAIVITPYESFGLQPLQKIEPSERFGNLLVYRGSFHLPVARAIRLYYRGINTLYSLGGGAEKALPLFKQSADVNPNFYPVWVELGNLHAQRGEREQAALSYENALRYLPEDPAIREVLSEQLRLVRAQPDPSKLHPVRDPFME